MSANEQPEPGMLHNEPEHTVPPPPQDLKPAEQHPIGLLEELLSKAAFAVALIADLVLTALLIAKSALLGWFETLPILGPAIAPYERYLKIAEAAGAVLVLVMLGAMVFFLMWKAFYQQAKSGPPPHMVASVVITISVFIFVGRQVGVEASPANVSSRPVAENGAAKREEPAAGQNGDEKTPAGEGKHVAPGAENGAPKLASAGPDQQIAPVVSPAVTLVRNRYAGQSPNIIQLRKDVDSMVLGTDTPYSNLLEQRVTLDRKRVWAHHSVNAFVAITISRQDLQPGPHELVITEQIRGSRNADAILYRIMIKDDPE